MFKIDEQSAEPRIASEVDDLRRGDEFHTEGLFKSDLVFCISEISHDILCILSPVYPSPLDYWEMRLPWLMRSTELLIGM